MASVGPAERVLESGPVTSEFEVKRVRSRRRARLAAGLWVAFAVIAWNNVFDREIRLAERGYLDRQVEHELGNGPGATVRGAMDPAVAAAARAATLWSGLPTLVGLIALWIAARRAGGRDTLRRRLSARRDLLGLRRRRLGT
jgi:hypothetical protein